MIFKGGNILVVLKFLFKIAPFLYMALVWILSSMPADAVVNFSIADSFIKESLHLVEFAILYVLFVFFLLVDGKLTEKTSLISAIVACLWGLTDEIHQYFVPYRSATFIDLVKDVTGVAVCFWIIKRSYFNEESKLGKFLHSFERLFLKK